MSFLTLTLRKIDIWHGSTARVIEVLERFKKKFLVKFTCKSSPPNTSVLVEVLRGHPVESNFSLFPDSIV